MKKFLLLFLLIPTLAFAQLTIPELDENTTPALDDLMYTIDVSDTTDSPDGTGKKVTLNDLFGVIEIDASAINLNTLNFGFVLGPADSTVQAAMDTIDERLDDFVNEGGVSVATNVLYDNDTYPNVSAALDALFYNAPEILTFTNNRNSLENGTVVTSTTLNWTVNKPMTTQSLNQSIGAVSAAATQYVHTNTYSTSRTYTLTVSDGENIDTANTSVTFKNSNYWGASATTPLNSAQIIALSDELATSNDFTKTISPVNQYMYVAYPASYGAASFTVNGLPDTDWDLDVQVHTNASGGVVSYNVYHTNTLKTGTYIVEVE